MKDLTAWLENNQHLPDFLRDFHDQKDVFKCVGCGMSSGNTEISWVDGHCYTIDKFLRFMAIHGYTLQKCRAKMPFKNIGETVKDCRDGELKSLSAILKGEKK